MLRKLFLLAAATPLFMSATVAVLPTDVYTFTAPGIGFDGNFNPVENDNQSWSFTITSNGPLQFEDTYQAVVTGSPNPNYQYNVAFGSEVTDSGGFDVYGPSLIFNSTQDSSYIEFDFLGTADFWQNVTPTPEQLTPADYGASTTNSNADWSIGFSDPPCNACYVSLPGAVTSTPEPSAILLLAAGTATLGLWRRSKKA